MNHTPNQDQHVLQVAITVKFLYNSTLQVWDSTPKEIARLRWKGLKCTQSLIYMYYNGGALTAVYTVPFYADK